MLDDEIVKRSLHFGMISAESPAPEKKNEMDCIIGGISIKQFHLDAIHVLVYLQQTSNIPSISLMRCDRIGPNSTLTHVGSP